MRCGTFESSASLKPDAPQAHFNLGTALAQAGRLDEAVAAFRTALAKRPGYTLAHNNLGRVLLAQGKTGEALKHLAEAVRLDAANPQALFGLAEAYAAVGSYRRGDRRDRPRPQAADDGSAREAGDRHGANSTCGASLSGAPMTAAR